MLVQRSIVAYTAYTLVQYTAPYTAMYTELVKLYTATYTTGAATVYCLQFYILFLYTVYRVVYLTWLRAVYIHDLSS